MLTPTCRNYKSAKGESGTDKPSGNREWGMGFRSFPFGVLDTMVLTENIKNRVENLLKSSMCSRITDNLELVAKKWLKHYKKIDNFVPKSY